MNSLSKPTKQLIAQRLRIVAREQVEKLKTDYWIWREEVSQRLPSTSADSGIVVKQFVNSSGDWLEEAILAMSDSVIKQSAKTEIGYSVVVGREIEATLAPFIDQLERTAVGVVLDGMRPQTRKQLGDSVRRELLRRKNSGWNRVRVSVGELEAVLLKEHNSIQHSLEREQQAAESSHQTQLEVARTTARATWGASIVSAIIGAVLGV